MIKLSRLLTISQLVLELMVQDLMLEAELPLPPGDTTMLPLAGKAILGLLRLLMPVRNWADPVTIGQTHT